MGEFTWSSPAERNCRECGASRGHTRSCPTSRQRVHPHHPAWDEPHGNGYGLSDSADKGPSEMVNQLALVTRKLLAR